MELHRFPLHLRFTCQYSLLDYFRTVLYRDRNPYDYDHPPTDRQNFLLPENHRKFHSNCHHVDQSHVRLEDFLVLLYNPSLYVFVDFQCYWSWIESSLTIG